MLKDLEKEIWSKESHEGKKLGEHIEECKKLTKEFLKFYNLTKYEEFANLLCYYHDLGKLREDWGVHKLNNPSHSNFSTFMFFEKEDMKNMENSILIPFFILKHHGILDSNINIERIVGLLPKKIQNDARKWFEDLLTKWRRNFYLNIKMNKIDNAIKIDLADTYGLFKFADILSAGNLANYKICAPNKNIEDLKRWILEKIQKKGFEIRNKDLQKQLNLSKVDGHLLVRAPTGWGKTAASLSYAVGKGSRIIYVLPTITSIKSFYNDLCSFFGKENVGELFYYADVEVIRREESDFRELLFSSYFAQPVIITTLDQLLLTFLQVGKYFLKRPHLRNSVIILDEVHTFSQNMLYIFSYFLERLAQAYNLRLCIMSATFPSVLKGHFKELLGRVEKLWLNEEFKNRRRVMFKVVEKDILDTLENIIEFYKLSKNPIRIVIVCNTVEKSQKVFEKIEDLILELGLELNRELLHSRFIYKHRCEKEDRINNWIRNGESFILVATQVIEVSLDISFDFMITECAPLESLVQRFGRVNRYRNRTEEINVWITFPSEINIKNKYPYDKEDVVNTWGLLKDLEGDNLENEYKLLEEYEKVAKLSRLKQREVNNLLEIWSENTNFLYSWRVDDEFVQRLLKFREEFTRLIVPSLYRSDVEQLYEKMKKEVSYTQKRKVFAEIKEYTVPIPIWMTKISVEEGFPIVDIFYDETYGIRKEINSII